MFNNIGRKIKALAKVICWIGIIISVLIGYLLFVSEELSVLGLIIAIVGSLSSWIGSFLLYGFGQLIDNSDILVKKQY